MIKYSVIKNGVEHWWYETMGGENHYEPSFGRKLGWYSEDPDNEALETREVETEPEILLYDEETGEITNTIPAVMRTEYLLPAQYEVIVEDLGNSLEMAALRAMRNQRLTACDWTQIADAPLSVEEKAAWAQYRQALRDLPENTEDPLNPAWPEKPE